MTTYKRNILTTIHTKNDYDIAKVKSIANGRRIILTAKIKYLIGYGLEMV